LAGGRKAAIAHQPPGLREDEVSGDQPFGGGEQLLGAGEVAVVVVNHP